MRLNKFIALNSGLSRRGADLAIESNRVTVNGDPALVGQSISDQDVIKLDGKQIIAQQKKLIILNKPVGYVCSRVGQGSKTIYDLLPKEYQKLKPVGRLDKDSSGLLLLTNDGEISNQLTHPSFQKEKIYYVTLDRVITKEDSSRLKKGINLMEGVSVFDKVVSINDKELCVGLHQGWNRQIRRTFEAIGYRVTKLHRTEIGEYSLPSNLKIGEFSEVEVL